MTFKIHVTGKEGGHEPIKQQKLKDGFAARNVKTGQLLSKYAGGFTWSSLTHALNNVESKCRGSYGGSAQYKTSDFVIEQYEYKKVDSWDAASVLLARKEEKQAKARSKHERDNKMGQIKNEIAKITLIPNLGPVEIRNLVANGILSETIINQVQPLLVEYYKWKSVKIK